MTAFDHPALGGVYKLNAIRDPDGAWQYKLKLSDEEAKTTNPGILQVRRYHTQNEFLCDVLYDTQTGLTDGCTLVDQTHSLQRRAISDGTAFTDLLVPVFRDGKAIYEGPALVQIRHHAQDQLSRLPARVKHLSNPQQYSVGLEHSLHELKSQLVRQAQGNRELQ